MNPNTRNQLKQILQNDGAKAVKKIVREKYGVAKPAHQGRMAVAQAVVREALSQVEKDARELVDELGFVLVVEGRSLLVNNDATGEYIAHAFAWGQLILNLKAWQENQPLQQVEVASASAPTPTKTFPQPRNVYLLKNWQPENMAVRLGDDGDSGNSALIRQVTVQLRDGSRKTIGKIGLSFSGGFYVSSGLWDQILPATEEMLLYSIKVMLNRNSIQLSDLADIVFNSVWYLGF
jgi:hypothetical protein